MKSFASVALLGAAAALVAAAPVEEKRDMVWHTTWVEVVETVMTTTTTWVAPGATVTAAAANPGGDFHETAVQYSPQAAPQVSTPAAPELSEPTDAPSSTEAPPPPPAPTTTSSTYVPPPPAPSPSSSTSEAPAAPAPAPTTSSVYVAPAPVSVYTPPPAAETPSPAPVASSASSPGSSSSSASGSGSGSGSGGVSYSDIAMTYYAPGMGSCGIVSSDSDMIVALARSTMTQSYSGNPNLNPMCGKKISITANGKTQTATIVDTCPGCKGPHDLDLSPALFQKFADESVGVISGASWTLLD